MNELFEIKSQSQTVGRIYIGTYNNNTGEMITVGPGFITVSICLSVCLSVLSVLSACVNVCMSMSK